MSNGETTRVSDLDLVSPTVMRPRQSSVSLVGSHPADILHSGNLCLAGYHRNCRCATSRICNGLYSQCTGVVLFQGGTVKVVFVVHGSGHNEKPVRKACVVGNSESTCDTSVSRSAATRPLILALVSHRMNWYPGVFY